ncbi:MAG: extracellular solute-binding protein [Actinomycetota bacterium]|nr:extracellular solute-binding protein [Actinomycetota bacterium]
METIDRRKFLWSSAAFGGAVLLAGCGGKKKSSAPAKKSQPPITEEPGVLNILEWQGYEASGTKAQTFGMLAGKDYTAQFGPNNLKYTYIVNDTQAINKARSGLQFDLMHPCIENLQDYHDSKLVQPWDTDLLPSFENLNPILLKRGQIDGKQYMIPWDWGYASILYRTDKVDPADATGWELFWNEKYKGKISMWDGAQSNFEVAALYLGHPDMDKQSADQVKKSKEALIKQKPLNKFYWKSEYSDMHPAFKSGDIWITYAWQSAYVAMRDAGLKVAFMEPKQGKLGWVCGFMLGAKTKNYHHAHKYVESFINHAAAVQMVNLFYYGNADKTIKPTELKDKDLAKKLRMGDPKALEGKDVNIQSWMKNENDVATAWQEVTAA